MSIFSTLNTGVSGINAAQVNIGVVSHNITNAQNPHYTRQRAVQQAADALHTDAGDIGMGTRIKTVVRIHDELVFTKMREQGSVVAEQNYLKEKLEEAARRFPDLSDAGLLMDMQNYNAAWNDFASNPADGAMKLNLITRAQTLADNLRDTRIQLEQMQKTTNQDIVLAVGEINRIGAQIAELNKEISYAESSGHMANDLRDKRDELEMEIAKQVSTKVFKHSIEQSGFDDLTLRDGGREYHLNIEGFSIVDGHNFHELKLDAVDAGSFMQNIYYEMQDGTRTQIATRLSGGRIGAALDLRGREWDSQKDGFYDGQLQDYIDLVDTLASEMIMQTNSIYAQAAQRDISSMQLGQLQPDVALTSIDNRVRPGEVDFIVYDNLGNEVVRKSVMIDPSTSIAGSHNMSSLVGKINADTDDNANHNNLDDFDDYFQAGYSWDEKTKSGLFTLFAKKDGYKVGIDDKGTNIAGVLGLGQFFSGKDARDVRVNSSLVEDPTKLRASSSGADGNNDIANAMNQLQYDVIEFHHPNGSVIKENISGFYRVITTKMAAVAQNNNTLTKTNEAIFQNIQAEYHSISGVNVNEELADLMKFQASFGASAKIISTIDRMMDTLLGIKQ